jgi:hypothetical protein
VRAPLILFFESLAALAVRTGFLSERRNFQCSLNRGKRLRGRCPHPRAPGALALSLDRERDLEKRLADPMVLRLVSYYCTR